MGNAIQRHQFCSARLFVAKQVGPQSLIIRIKRPNNPTLLLTVSGDSIDLKEADSEASVQIEWRPHSVLTEKDGRENVEAHEAIGIFVNEPLGYCLKLIQRPNNELQWIRSNWDPMDRPLQTILRKDMILGYDILYVKGYFVYQLCPAPIPTSGITYFRDGVAVQQQHLSAFDAVPLHSASPPKVKLESKSAAPSVKVEHVQRATRRKSQTYCPKQTPSPVKVEPVIAPRRGVRTAVTAGHSSRRAPRSSIQKARHCAPTHPLRTSARLRGF